MTSKRRYYCQQSNGNKNQLTTGTLTTSNLENTAEFEADAIGFSASVSINSKDDVTGLPTPLSAGGVGEQRGMANSTTLSGISAGTITITDDRQTGGRPGRTKLTI